MVDSKSMLKEKRPVSAAMVITNIIIVILSLVLLIMGITLVTAVHGYGRNIYVSEPRTFMNSYNYHHYENAVADAYHNQNAGTKMTEEYESLYAVAFYYDAATMELVYRRSGMDELADQKKQYMEEQRAKMRDKEIFADDIDDFLAKKAAQSAF